MPRQTRNSTEYRGVYFVELANKSKSYFIRYKSNGMSVEERAGRSDNGWDAELAYLLRAERIKGIDILEENFQRGSDLKTGQYWTFSKIFKKYLRLRPDLKGRENDIYRFKNYIEMVFADVSPKDVSYCDVERFRHNLQNKGLKPATVGHVLELFRRLANFAAKKKYCAGLSFKLEIPRVENQKTEDLSQHQLDKLLQVLKNESDLQVSNLVRMALFTGMRRGELFELCWRDIDFHNKTITVRSGKKGQFPKIPLNEIAEKVLTEHAQLSGSSKFIFPNKKGKKRTECKRALIRIRKNAGLPNDFRLLQGLRHVYARILVSGGEVNLKTLQSLLTQKSPLMTQRYSYLLNCDDKISKSEIELQEAMLDDSKGYFLKEQPKKFINSEYKDSKSKQETNQKLLATQESSALFKNSEIINDRIEIDRNSIALDPKIITDEGIIKNINISIEEKPYNLKESIITENEESEIVTSFCDLEDKDEYTKKVMEPEYSNLQIPVHNKENKKIFGKTDDLNDNNEKIKKGMSLHKIKNQDVEISNKINRNKFVDGIGKIQTQEGTISERLIDKKSENFQLANENLSVITKPDNDSRVFGSIKNVVKKKKLVEQIKNMNRPNLKELKNDLDSLSELIKTASIKSKS